MNKNDSVMKEILYTLFEHRPLGRDQARELLVRMARGEVNDSQMAALMTVYLMRSITVDELAGFRDALSEMRLAVDLADYDPIDIVGTGGDGKNTFNISTAACFVVAGAGFPVVKHGNYGSSSVSGASNVLEYHGVKFSSSRDQMRRSLDACGMAYLHAPLFSPALKAVAGVRRELGVRTFFNMLGPLANPVMPRRQMLGVFDLKLARMYYYLYQQLSSAGGSCSGSGSGSGSGRNSGAAVDGHTDGASLSVSRARQRREGACGITGGEIIGMTDGVIGAPGGEIPRGKSSRSPGSWGDSESGLAPCQDRDSSAAGGVEFAVVTSLDGYDEISLTADFKVFTPRGENVYAPEEIGFRRIHPEDLSGGESVAEAAKIFDSVLAGGNIRVMGKGVGRAMGTGVGQATGKGGGTASAATATARVDCVVANAAFAIRTAMPEMAINEAITRANESIESGRAMAAFKKFLEINSHLAAGFDA